MKRNFLIIILLLSAITSYSQSKSIVGAWHSLDSINKIHFIIKSNGTIEKRIGTTSEDIWNKTPMTGTYTFKKGHSLIIRWADKSTENIEVKFVDNNAEFWFSERKANPNKPQIFLRLVDEEIIPDK